MPERKTTAKKAPAKSTTRTSAPRKTPKNIRNLRGTVVHARLYSQNPKDPFRIALNPRGQSGDATIIPVALQDDPTFLQGVGVLWEIITATEAKSIQYGQVGYLGRTDAPEVIRPEDTTVTAQPEWDGKGRMPQRKEAQVTPIQTKLADVPGSDTGLHETIRGGADALPEGVDISSRRVAIERVKGE